MPHTLTQALPPSPLVGRDADLSTLLALVEQGEAGRGGAVLLTGAAGVGKSRLSRVVAEEAERRGWQVAFGRAYPVERGVPYALVADAFVPLLQGLDPATLAVLARGEESGLARLFPALGALGAPTPGLDAAEVKSRLMWNFGKFLARLSERQPVLVVLEDMHWADESSLELAHFLARHAADHPTLLIATYVDSERDTNATLRTLERSMLGAAQAVLHTLRPLNHGETSELVRRTFDVSPAVSREFTALLYGWTRGNPFFVQEVLKSLIDAGKLRLTGGTWIGWEVGELSLPPTVRDVVAARLERVSEAARRVVETAAVIGTRARYELIHAVLGGEEAVLLEALEELCRLQILEEAEGQAEEPVYDFSHPLVRETLYARLARARRRLLHTTVAESAERLYGARAGAHANELAYHYARGDTTRVGPKAVHYLVAAGCDALLREANREAADYLAAALDLSDAVPSRPAPDLLENLARVRSRLGEVEAARSLLARALALAREDGDALREALVLRRLGLASFWAGQYLAAAGTFDEALQAAGRAGADELRVRLLLGKGASLQEVGRHEEAEAEVKTALAIAEELRSDVLLARAHRALAFLYTWTGPPARAREHGLRALEFAERCGDPVTMFAVHWAMAVLGGLTGDSERVLRHHAECERLADESRSVRLRIAAAEIGIEYANGAGNWDEGIALGERTIALARELGQRNLLPRVLVWTALIHLRRGDFERGRAYVDEAWALSGADAAAGGQVVDVHSVVPAHIGRAVEHLARYEFREAVTVGEAGLVIADRSGYVVWAIHRLLPSIAEGYLASYDVEGARRIGARLRRDSERMEHRLGLAWADACDALVDWMDGHLERSIGRLRAAAERLEAIPFIPDAARMSRQVALRLQEAGRTEEAIREMRRVHETFLRLGAMPDLKRTRDSLRDLGSRPPTRGAAGIKGLTTREVEIVKLVAAGKSNKAIGQRLAISKRTVSTHLSNIFKKLGLTSRDELSDLARRLELPEP